MKSTADSHNRSTLHLRVHPNAVRNEIVGVSDGILQIKVAAPPVKGKANRELIDYLSRVLEVSKSSLTIVKGHTSRNKVIAIGGIEPQDIIQRLSV